MEALARVTSYANASEQMSAAAILDQMRLGLRGVIYIDGGWGTLVEGLAKAAKDAGAVLNTGAAVERIAMEGRCSRLVLADGTERIADATILALGPKVAAGLGRSVASLRDYADAATPIRANTLDLALKRLPDGARSFVLGIDQPLYFSIHTNAAKLAPEDGAVIHIARYMATGEKVEANAIAELEALADLAMPGWRDLEVKRQELRGMVVANSLVRPDQSRPDVELADAPGLFIAGDWVGEEGMISDASAASASKAARRALYWLSGKTADRTAA
jgi:phytoene dehydrogenase-like protein